MSILKKRGGWIRCDKGKERVPLEQRFWAKVDKRGSDECWEWTGARLRSRGELWYGQVHRGGVTAYAHRVAWELANGPVPDGLHVRHKCDNPACVNPAHLEVGTHQDNVNDMVARGRHVGFRKLDEWDVKFIRHWCRKYRHKDIAECFGLKPRTISPIKCGRVWADVSPL